MSLAVKEFDDLIERRKSVRAYSTQSVAKEDIFSILELASRAPSGTNMQPWKVYVLEKPRIDEIHDAIIASGIKPSRAVWDEYQYYPNEWFEPYRGRRAAIGEALYSSLGIGKRDVAATRKHINRNFNFFGASVGFLIAIDRRLEKGSWIDLGMFMQNILLAAEARGLATCPQAAFAPFHKQIRPIINMPDSEVLVCGVALGYADPNAPENQFQTERAPLEDWVTMVD